MSLVISTAKWGYHRITSRVVNTSNAALDIYNTAILAAQAVFNSAAYLASLGTNKISRNISAYNTMHLNYQVPNTFFSLLAILNPNYCRVKTNQKGEVVQGVGFFTEKTSEGKEKFPLPPSRIDISSTSEALKPFAKWQYNLMNNLNQGNLFNRHVTARLAAPLTGLIAIVYAAVRMVFGVIGAVLATIPFCGTNCTLNQFAWQNLGNAGFIINQFQNGLLGIIRPDLV